MKPLEWSSQSPDLNSFKMLWYELMKAIHAQKPPKDTWAKITPNVFPM